MPNRRGEGGGMGAENSAKAFSVGQEIWLPCGIQSGPFPNERRVYLKVEGSEWSGFVSTSELIEAEKRVRATVLRVGPGDWMVVGIRGNSPASRPIEARPAAVREQLYGTLYA